jgi:hypothetical protein
MPRLRPAPNEKQEPVIQHFEEAPTEGIEIELPDDDVTDGTEVDLAPEVEKKPEPKPEVDDNPLQKALDAQQRAEELQRTAQRERDEALRQNREHQQELTRERGDRQDAEYNSVLTAIAAEQATLENAESQYAAFASAGDWANAAKAQRIMASAASRVDRLEDSKQAFEKTKTEQPTQRQPAAATPPQLDFEQKIVQLPDSAKTWLRKHPEYINDTALNRKIQAAHGAIVDLDGVEAFSPAYFDALDTRFGFKARVEPEPKPQPKQRSIPMTAPPSRDVPSTSGQRSKPGTVTLTAEERLIARTSIMDRPDLPKMTNAEKELLYARNKARLLKMRQSGEYRQTTEQTG